MPAKRPMVPSVTVADVLVRSYAQFADVPAVLGGAAVMTYRELGERAHRVAAGLRAAGVQAEDRAVLLAGNCPAFFEVEHALFLSGVIRVALSHRLHPREVAGIINDCQAAVVFADESWMKQLAEFRDDLPSVIDVVDIAMAADKFGLDQTPHPAARYQVQDDAAPDADDLAALLYTSGTTGRPKGAALTHRNWVAMMRNSLVEFPPLSEHDVVLHVAPLSHLSGYIATTCFSRGAAHVVLPSFDPAEVFSAISRFRVTVVALVPTMINAMLLAAERMSVDVSSLRLILYGGAPIAPARLSRAVELFGPVFVQFYGLSETPMPLSALSQRDHVFDPTSPPERLGSAGRVNPFVQVTLAGDDGRPAATGDIGEIVTRGDTVMAGYWQRPDETSQMIDDQGWAHTGDLGRFDQEGYLYVVDRKKDMIITGGYNVYPTEVENVIATIPEVQEVAVVGAPDDHWGECVTAVVVPRPGRELTADDVVVTCERFLASYKKPRRVVFVDELPKTGSGKLMRRQVRDQFWSGQERKIGG